MGGECVDGLGMWKCVVRQIRKSVDEFVFMLIWLDKLAVLDRMNPREFYSADRMGWLLICYYLYVLGVLGVEGEVGVVCMMLAFGKMDGDLEAGLEDSTVTSSVVYFRLSRFVFRSDPSLNAY